MKKLALFDIDGVFYDGHIVFDVIQDQEEKGIIPSGTWNCVLAIMDQYKKGVLNYKGAADKMLLVHSNALKGQKYEDMVEYMETLVVKNSNKFFPYFLGLSKELKKTYDIYLVTTNFDFAAQVVTDYFHLTGYLSSIIGQENGVINGKVKLSLGGNKSLVAKYIRKYGKSGCLAVGDSENDADMLDGVELPLVMEPNPKLKAIAKERGWKIVNRKNIAGIIRSYARQSYSS